MPPTESRPVLPRAKDRLSLRALAAATVTALGRIGGSASGLIALYPVGLALGLIGLAHLPIIIGVLLFGATALVGFVWIRGALTHMALAAWRGESPTAREALARTGGRTLANLLATWAVLASAPVACAFLLWLGSSTWSDPATTAMNARTTVAFVGLAALTVATGWLYVRCGALVETVVVAEKVAGPTALRRAFALSGRQPIVRAWLASGAVWMAVLICISVSVALVTQIAPELTGQDLASETLSAVIGYAWWAVDASWATYVYAHDRDVVAPIPTERATRSPVHAVTAIVCLLGITAAIEAESIHESLAYPSGAMLPTIHIGDHVHIDKLTYGIDIPGLGRIGGRDPRHGDVAVFVDPEGDSEILTLRIVAIGGDRIELRDRQLILNGSPVEEPYVVHVHPERKVPELDQLAEMLVPAGHFFALADNRDESRDSRLYGVVPIANLRGTARFVYWSRERDSGQINWQRIGASIE